MTKQSGLAHVVIIGVLVIALIGALGFIFWQNFMQKTSTDDQADASQQTTNTGDATEDTVASNDTTTTNDTVAKGTIKGAAVYPSDGYPSDFKVCALNKSTKAEVACDTSVAGKLGKQSYEIAVAAGDYLVAAKTGTMVGYYDGYMQNQNYYKSGIDLCKNEYHTPLVVTVAADKTVSGIDAGNFYYEPANC